MSGESPTGGGDLTRLGKGKAEASTADVGKPSFAWRSPRALAALAIAVIADGVQIGLLPIFAPGLSAVVDGGLDLVVGAILVALLGWHLAFLPAFVNELVPFLDLFPTWTAAVVFVLARRSHKASRTPRPGVGSPR